jgi:hypothetical protein
VESCRPSNESGEDESTNGNPTAVHYRRQLPTRTRGYKLKFRNLTTRLGSLDCSSSAKVYTGYLLFERYTMTLTQQILAEATAINVAITLAVTLVVIPMGVWIYDKYRFRALPPGPPTRPFIGNKHLIPASRPWLKMAEWSETYVCPTSV